MSSNYSKDSEKILAKRKILEAFGGTLDCCKFAKLIEESEEEVNKLAKRGLLLRFEQEQHGFVYPIWQIHNKKLLNGLKEVMLAFNTDSMWSKQLFFITENDYLEGVLATKFGRNDITPIDALRKGYIDSVLIAQSLEYEQ